MFFKCSIYKNENTIYRDLWDAAKAMLTRKFIALKIKPKLSSKKTGKKMLKIRE